MTKVYVSGPVTCASDGQKQNFRTAADLLHQLGLTPVVPYDPEDNGKAPYRSYINEGLQALMGCDMICLLPGWRDSAGAKLEQVYAETVRMPMLFLKKQKGKVWIV